MKNTPAFPIQHQIIDANDINFKLGDSGMSLRDYFAAKAMQSYILHPDYEDASDEWLADCSYLIADEMMKARGE
jgi:hypothetical protein